MPYFSGDIILKVDTRANADTIHTRHHVMLVIGQSLSELPIVAHMATATGKLVIETLTRGTKLDLIHFDWDESTRATIANAAEQAHHSGKYFISDAVIKDQLQPVSQYRPSCRLEREQKLKQLHAKFNKESHNVFTPSPEIDIIMSCHEFVVSLIHFGCHKTGTAIPKALQITPSLAWADCLYMAAKYDDTASIRIVSIISQQPKEEKIAIISPSLASQPEEIKTTSCLPNFFRSFKSKSNDTSQMKINSKTNHDINSFVTSTESTSSIKSL
ncbi:MAG: hypothetical protein ABI597_03125 [Gammaproteobacteria bacterium]